MSSPLSARTVLLATSVVALAMVGLDLVWLGAIAQPFYQAQLGPLMAKPPLLAPAAAFYLFYIGVIMAQAVAPADSPKNAAGRGAWLGFVAYATYELTNWAVIQGWPAGLVPVDLGWGILLTAAVSGVGRAAWEWSERRVASSQ
ncbi:MAG: DUF2177 family protein [Candidatus Sericytochromatia bacterium]|nr:DUF2177 family protein [Candidatus Sericytochromatia bacterium]